MPSNQRPIAVGSDHAGFALKQEVQRMLEKRGLAFEDVGCDSTESVDYPDFAKAVCEEIQKGKAVRGILICGSGIGMAIAANRGPRIRAAACTTDAMARLSRQHNDANVLCLGARLNKPEEVGAILEAWLTAEFEGGRHTRRIEKIDAQPPSAFEEKRPQKVVRIVDHPLVQHKLTYLRDRRVDAKIFREIVDELSTLMAYEVTRDLPTDEKRVSTPMELEAIGHYVRSERIGIVPILRAGLGMIHGIMKVIPMAAVGHIGIFRDHDSLKPVTYYAKLPERCEDRLIIVVDPMLATGGSAVAAVDAIKSKGARRIRFCCILAAPDGIAKLHGTHPDVEIFTSGIDHELNAKGYILPGLGDAGDRLFGTR
jgi:uracil phosphoribosyltransferase